VAIVAWEYHVIVLREHTLAERAETLDELGREGWELVAVVQVVRSWKGHYKTEGRIERDGTVAIEGDLEVESAEHPVMAYFKRRVE
jgi:hypothetical protein